MSDKPIWKFDKIKITQIQPYFDMNHVRSHDKCYISIDFGFFFVHDIGITNDDKFGLSWSQAFGWSMFKFNDSYIDNPYGDEVRKLEIMIKNEMENKKDIIIDFLNSSNILSSII